MEEGAPRIPDETYQMWAARSELVNPAVCPGSGGFTVIDVDEIEHLPEVLKICGKTDFMTLSGREGGGVHLWYTGVNKSGNGVGPGVDVKSSGGYVIAPGAMHWTGVQYKASEALSQALATGELRPPRLKARWRKRLEAFRDRLKHAVREPTRYNLAAVLDELRRKRRSADVALLRRVHDGQPLAGDGDRLQAMKDSLRLLHQAWPEANVESISGLYARSMSAMAAEGARGTNDHELRRFWAWLTQSAATEADDVDAHLADLRRRAWGLVGELGCDDYADVGDTPICVSTVSGEYYLRIGDKWVGPYKRPNITEAVLKPLAALYELEIPDNAALINHHTRHVSKVRERYTCGGTVWEEGTLVIARGTLRRGLAPARSALAEEWIRGLAGEYVGQLNMWLLGLLRPDHPCRVLVLEGAGRTSKSAFLRAIGECWEGDPPTIQSVVGRKFNASMTRSWLSIADDNEQQVTEAGDKIGAYIRDSLSHRSRYIERKGHEQTELEGCLRMAIATNDIKELARSAVGPNANNEALEAYGDRILHIPVPASMVGYWDNRQPDLRRLIEGGELASHILWLNSCLPSDYVPSDRFWVGPASQALTDTALIGNSLRGEIACFVAAHVANDNVPAWVPGSRGGAEMYRDNGNLLVNTAGLMSIWGNDKPHKATLNNIGRALKAMAGGRKMARRGATNYHVLDLHKIMEYAEELGVG